MNRKSQRGIALVITLMMLAIITIVAVIFLGIARRNRAGISLRSSQTDAEYAADYALNRAKAEMLAQIRATTNLLGYDMTVSMGFDRPPFGTNYLRDPAGTNSPVWGPVVIDTNRPSAVKGPLESRFYLDLNRNRQFDPATNLLGGDPEWIFILDNPRRPYGQNNHFIARYAYMVVPSGKALDINSIHNTSGTNSFLRNQGVGAFEINLAALLNEIDTNLWPYAYAPLAPVPLSLGQAFLEASNITSFRTNIPGVRPQTLEDIFGAPRALLLASNGVDDLADDGPGGLFFGTETPGNVRDNTRNPYPGAEAARHYFSHQDLFDPAKTSPTFTNALKLLLGGTNGYKFYDLIGSLATDTGNENQDKINLNWANIDGYSVSSLTSWDDPTNRFLPLIFFTNAAQRILQSMSRDFFPWVTSVNAIMVYPTNYYDNAMHRIMQQAANIFDAARTNEFPTVFRPVTGRITGEPGTNLYIIAWTNDSSVATLPTWLANNTNSLPLVIGAKKGLPNFNEYTFRTDALITRKLQLIRPTTNSFPNQTNQMYIMGLSNSFAVESWNSYSTPFPAASHIDVSNVVTMTLSNSFGIQAGPTTYTLAFSTNIGQGQWLGRDVLPDHGFKLPLMTNLVVLSNSVYLRQGNRFAQVGTNIFETVPVNDRYYLPYWTLTISNYLVYTHTVGTNLIDFVTLSDVTTNDLVQVLALAPSPVTPLGVSVWDTNRAMGGLGPTEGMRAQVDFSKTPGAGSEWTDFSAFVGDRNRAANKFNDFLLKRGTELTNETPFNPIARLTRIATWQANDPLVHYHVDDLTAFQPSVIAKSIKWKEQITATENPSSLTNINKAYSPWGQSTLTMAPGGDNFNTATTDPGMSASDNWDFPNHKYPSVGWLGRVHRGTPWQTVYLKSGAASLADWRKVANNLRNHPTNDYRLADIFTTALTDNSARGLLSINQSHLPAWSAALSGVVVLTNILDDGAVTEVTNRLNRSVLYSTRVIEPTGGSTNAPVWRIWDAIQRQRQAVGGVFSDFSQLLMVPQLTTQSPYLNLTDAQQKYGIDDEAYERIPQQILGLLRIGDSRFVIYSYGQALKPERVNSSSGAVENYQITAEFATRTVMRVEGTAKKPRAVVESFNILPPD